MEVPALRRVLISDSPETVSALASWLNDRLDINEKQCSVLALALLERKELKIKRGALDRVLKSLRGPERVDEMRATLTSEGLIAQLGRDEFGPYGIRLDAAGIDADAVLEALRAEQTDEDADGADGVEQVAGGNGTRADGDGDSECRAKTDTSEQAPKAGDAADADAAVVHARRDSDSAAPASAPGKREGRTRECRERRHRPARKDRGQRVSEPLAKRAAQKPVASERVSTTDARRDESRPHGLAVIKRGLGVVASLRERVVKGPASGKIAKASAAKQSVEQPTKPDDVARVRMWLEVHKGETVPYASRRQRAYQIFDDEKALEGKRGDRLMRRLTAKGISSNVLRIASNQTPPLQGFYGLGADQPFIVVENIDTYEEIVALLKGRRSVRLFGKRVGGVIFGAGHNVCIAHALDDYLNDIGYGFPYVYYAGDVDREGARLVERAREVNVIEIRLHAGMYRAMFAANRAHVQQQGNDRESAADNQEHPRDFARLVKDLPVSLRIPFRRALHDNIRIPQEVLTSEDFRRSSHGAVDRLLNS